MNNQNPGINTNVTYGFSPRINDPRVQSIAKKNTKAGIVFTIIMAAIAIIGFAIAGEMEVGGFENPSATFMGFGIGGMLIVIAILQLIKTSMEKTWDGVIIDKVVKQPTHTQRQQGQLNPKLYFVIRKSNNKVIRTTTTEQLMDYYQVGDQIRNHAGLSKKHIYEKFDKTRDNIIYCITCSSKNDIQNDLCNKCKCPLLK